jgi:hypothetical protein
MSVIEYHTCCCGRRHPRPSSVHLPLRIPSRWPWLDGCGGAIRLVGQARPPPQPYFSHLGLLCGPLWTNDRGIWRCLSSRYRTCVVVRGHSTCLLGYVRTMLFFRQFWRSCGRCPCWLSEIGSLVWRMLVRVGTMLKLQCLTRLWSIFPPTSLVALVQELVR